MIKWESKQYMGKKMDEGNELHLLYVIIIFITLETVLMMILWF